MSVRIPVVAGSFYPDSVDDCRREADSLLSSVEGSAKSIGLGRAVGGIVPHAGWVCSGRVAAGVIKALTDDPEIETFVIFGAVHRRMGPEAAVMTRGSWRTPLGDLRIDEELARSVIDDAELFVDDESAHAAEHSIEVDIPLLRSAAPRAMLLPIMVPPTDRSHQVGRFVAERAKSLGRRFAVLGSSDLTHYGPRYGFTPRGVGSEGLRWAKDVNDRRILDMIVSMQAEEVVAEALEHRNACGSGAIAATIAASKACGATAARVLDHTTSREVLKDRFGDMDDAVGYGGVVFFKPQCDP